MVVYIIYINDARSSKYQIKKYFLLIKYIKSVLWGVAKRLSYIQDARCLKVKASVNVLIAIIVKVVMRGTFSDANRKTSFENHVFVSRVRL